MVNCTAVQKCVWPSSTESCTLRRKEKHSIASAHQLSWSPDWTNSDEVLSFTRRKAVRRRSLMIPVQLCAVFHNFPRIVRKRGSWFFLFFWTSANDRCLFPHHQVDEQPNKKPKKQRPRRESDDKNAVAIVKIVSQLGCVSQDSDALVLQGRKSRETDAESLGTNVKGTIHQVYATSYEYPGKEGTIVGTKKIKLAHQRSPYAVKSEDRLHEETERQERCARSKAWNLAKNIYKLKENTRMHSTFPRRNGFSRLRQRKSRRKGSLW